jgi:hypothetical protein
MCNLVMPLMPDCSSHDRTYSRIGLFATGSRDLGQVSSPWLKVSGRNLEVDGADTDTFNHQ